MSTGAFIAFVVMVAYMAPKHWEWYHQNVNLQASLRNAAAERDHYKNLIRPNEWGPVAQHEARIVKTPPYQGIELKPGESIDFVFDDIKDGGDR